MSAGTATLRPAPTATGLDALRRQVLADHLTDHSPGWVAYRTVASVAVWCGASAAGLLVDRWWMWALVWWVQALCLVGSYSAMHEGTHGSLARSRARNHILAACWGLTILWNAALWRQFHLAHHAHTGTDRDPEPREEVRTPARYLVGVPLAGVWFLVAQWVISARAAVTGSTPGWGRSSGRRAARLNGVVLLFWTGLIVAAAVAEPGLMLRLWMGPCIVAVLVVAPGTGITEHFGCASSRGGGPPATDPFVTTRSVVTNPVVRFLFWQNNYHAAHHAFPAVPAHHAARVHRLVAGRTVHLSPGYVRFHLTTIRQLAGGGR